MALRVDAEVLRSAVGEELFHAGDECRARVLLTGLEALDGGAAADVAEPDGRTLNVWVGVVDGALTGECDCPDASDDASVDEPCEHAVAVALAAIDAGMTWASLTSEDDADDGDEGEDGGERPLVRLVAAAGPEEAEAWREKFRRAAQVLRPDDLVALVVDFAAADEDFAAELLARAGLVT